MNNHRMPYAPGLALLLSVWACSIEQPRAGINFACSDGICPEALQCVERRCVATGVTSDAAVALDAAVSDAGDDCSCVPAASFDSCTDALELTDQARVCRSTANNSNKVLGCTGQPMPGPDMIFRVFVGAGETLNAQLRPEGFDGALYLGADCAGSCLAVANELGLGGTEVLNYSAQATGDLYLVVDSSFGSGCFDLQVQVGSAASH